jgi:hypothetical protein
MVLALIRLWDTNPRAVRMQSISAALRESEVVDALALDRVRHLGLPEAIGAMRDDLGKKAGKVGFAGQQVYGRWCALHRTGDAPSFAT